MKLALKAGFLSFDSTRVSNNDVEFPIDVVLYKKDTFAMVEYRYEKKDLENISELWAEKLKNALDDIPDDWMEKAFNQPVPSSSYKSL
jgi:putative proteasome-type protease